MEEVSSAASTPPTNGVPGEDHVVLEQVNADLTDEQAPNADPPNAPRARKRAAASTSTSQQTKKKGKNQKKQSWCWDHFEKIQKNGLKRAVCNYCQKDVCGDSRDGTSVMSNHLKRCSEYPLSEKNKAEAAGQMTLNFKADRVGGESSMCDNEVGEKRGKIELWKFKQEDTRLALAKKDLLSLWVFHSSPLLSLCVLFSVTSLL